MIDMEYGIRIEIFHLAVIFNRDITTQQSAAPQQYTDI